jgi:hypothetical protein
LPLTHCGHTGEKYAEAAGIPTALSTITNNMGIFITIICSILWLSPAYAQEISGIQLNGYVEAENKTYFKEINPDKE